ncbi:Hypothetical protein NTJ_07066 [Nesidiocoris tenuis]|uniref:UPAR/Ly6 domain-containing protein n=1 Tax=Nesidiocoris tenuis TaxID=355587 RepID=A0ABN7APW4_9HEMI|nr:Hypothetical protein NTJ_07066 [Nesidiocoris tenuis]
MVKATSDPQPASKQQGGVTCYTCVNVSDNLMCNQYAIDSPCPTGEDFCHTLHIMDSTGASVVVNKKCADSTECWPLGVGCVIVDTQTICVSCCDEMYCNVTVPTNQSNAIFSNRRTQHRSKFKNPYPPLDSSQTSITSIRPALCLSLALLKSIL